MYGHNLKLGSGRRGLPARDQLLAYWRLLTTTSPLLDAQGDPVLDGNGEVIYEQSSSLVDSIGKSIIRYAYSGPTLLHTTPHTYYVSNATGDDSRTALQAQDPATPWKNHPDSNLATGNCAAQRLLFVAGDRVVMSRGETWWGTQLTSAVIGAADDPVVTTSLSSFGVGDGSLPVIAAASLLDGEWTATGVNGEYKISLVGQSYVVYADDVELISGTPGSLVDNGFGWLADELYVKIGENPSGLPIQAAITYALKANKHYREYSYLDVRYSNDETSGALYTAAATTQLVLTGSRFSRGRRYAARLFTSTSPVVTDCDFTSRNSILSSSPIALYVSNGGGSGVFDGITVDGGPGVGVELVATGTLIRDSNFAGDNIGLRVTASSCRIEENTFSCWNGLGYDAGGSGNDIKIDTSSADNVITRNTFINGYVNIVTQPSSGNGNNIISFNKLIKPKVNGIYLSTGGTTVNPDRVLNNLIIQHGTAGDPPGSIGHGVVITSLEVHGKECNKGVVKNNLFVGEVAGAEMVSFDATLDAYPAGMAAFDIDYNIYWQRDTGASWRLSDVGTDITDFATWKTTLATAGVTGADANSINIVGESSDVVVDVDNGDFRLTQKRAGTVTSLTGTDDIYDAAGIKIYDGTLQLPDGPAIAGVDIGPYAYQVGEKYYLALTIVSGTGPTDWVVKLPAAPHIINILGLDSTWFDASGVPKEVAFGSLGDDVHIFDGSKGQVVIYSIDKSADATKIHRAIGA